MKKHILSAFIILSIATLQAQVLLKDINPSFAGSGPFNFKQIGNTLFFIADDGVHGSELWKTDGTTQGTVMVKDICTGPESSVYLVSTETFTSKFVEMNGMLYFPARDTSHGIELWKSDGTDVGTVMIKDSKPGFQDGVLIDRLFALGNTLYFNGGGSSNYELWKSDGTDIGTVLLKEINPNGGSHPDKFIEFNGKVVFTATDDIHGTEWWKTDGTDSGTSMIKDIYPGYGSSSFGSVLPIEYNGKLYFTANDSVNGEEIWSSDLTASGTTLLKNINGNGSAYIGSFFVYNNKLLFSADNGFYGSQLWITDGTAPNTYLVKRINTTGAANPIYFTGLNGKVYFCADNGVDGIELYVTDGTTTGTQLVKDLYPQAGMASFPRYLTVAGNKFYFAAADSAYGPELWQSDGTAAGTTRLSDICADVCGGDPAYLIHFGNAIIFTANAGDFNYELYKYDLPATGITETTQALNFKLMPNPANNLLQVITTDYANSYQVYDVQGKLALQGNLTLQSNNTIDVSGIAAGLYLLKLTGAGGQQGVSKFVKR